MFCSPRHRTSTLEQTYQSASWDAPSTAELEECFVRAKARVLDGSAVLRTPTNYPRQRGRMANNVGRRFRGRLESMRKHRIIQKCGWCKKWTHRTQDCPRKGAAALVLHSHGIRLGANLGTASPTVAHENDSPNRAPPPRTRTVQAGSGIAAAGAAAAPAAAISTLAGAHAPRFDDRIVSTAGSRTAPPAAAASPAVRAAAVTSASHSNGRRGATAGSQTPAPGAAASTTAAAPAPPGRSRQKEYVAPTQAQHNLWQRHPPNCDCRRPAKFAIAGTKSKHLNRAYYKCQERFLNSHLRPPVGCDYFRACGDIHGDAQVWLGVGSQCWSLAHPDLAL